jgi:hypothetical protein
VKSWQNQDHEGCSVQHGIWFSFASEIPLAVIADSAVMALPSDSSQQSQTSVTPDLAAGS